MKHPTRIPALRLAEGLRLTILSLALAALTGARAQTAAPAAGSGTDELTRLDTYEVTGVPLGRSINPLTRESSAVMGDARGPLDTPRAASTITAALVDERAVHGLREILEYSPGAYAPSSYGELTVPYLRGDVAESYVNGQRRSNNFYGYLPSFNGVEAVDVVRGAGSAVFGAGYLTGGYVNYQTKQPSFAGPATAVTTRLGTWAPGGGSFLNGSVQVDTTAPVSPRLAWRFSYEGKGGDTFYQQNGYKDDREELFGALTWKPRPGVTFDFNAQWLWQDTNESLGVNRVNQNLVWHGLYYTGLSEDLAYNPGPIPATGAVTLPWNATLLSRGDYAQAHVASAQLIATIEVSPSLTFVNRTLYEWVNRHRVYAMGYVEFVTQNTFENRTEAHLQLAGALPQSIVTGATVRLQAVLGYENYANEYLYNFDLTDPSRVFPQAQSFPSSYLPGTVGPGGQPFFSPVDPNYPTPETGDSRVWDPAVFAQDDIKLAERWHLLLGARSDWFQAHARDPLPPAGTAPADDRASHQAISGDASLLFRPGVKSSYYLTWQNTTSLNGNLAGGGISLQPDGHIDPLDLANRSVLLEAGAKYSLLDNRLFAGAALFDQRRQRTSLGDVHEDIRVSGLELEAVYQPDTRFSATLNATLQDGHYLNSAPFQLGGRDIYAGYAAGRGPGGLGTGDASFSPWSNQVPAGDWAFVGFSRVMLNGSVRQRWSGGWGASLDGQWGSPQHGNLDNQWHIPSQYTLNASLFWERGPWRVNVDVLNLTNQRNWIHNGDAYTASELILPELPRRVEGYVKYRF
ncbi:MAG: TonB-dependent receptor [Opitutales bacterium]